MGLFHRRVDWQNARRCEATYGKVNWRCVREAGHKDEHIAWGKGTHPWVWRVSYTHPPQSWGIGPLSGTHVELTNILPPPPTGTSVGGKGDA